MKNRIRELRLKAGLTQEQLAKETGISSQSISKYEACKRKPKIEQWQKLADYFNVSVPYLQGFDVDGKEKPCDYCNFSKRDRAAYPLYIGDTFVGFVYLDNNRNIAVDLRKIGTAKTREPVNGCPNCRRDLRNK